MTSCSLVIYKLLIIALLARIPILVFATRILPVTRVIDTSEAETVKEAFCVGIRALTLG